MAACFPAGLIHAVLISFRNEVDDATRQRMFDMMQTLDADCGGAAAGILYWKVGWNLDLRKNVNIVEVAVFADNDALQRFRAHPMHKRLTDLARDVADWQVGDMTV